MKKMILAGILIILAGYSSAFAQFPASPYENLLVRTQTGQNIYADSTYTDKNNGVIFLYKDVSGTAQYTARIDANGSLLWGSTGVKIAGEKFSESVADTAGGGNRAL